MKTIKKKKGSTFLIVVIVMAIIFTTGTTILAVTANDYKMRINQSKKLQNLYEADSGLDVVENIIIKTSQEAIKYADKEVKRKFTELDNNDRSKEKVNLMFKEKFYEFLSEPKRIRDSNQTFKDNVKILEYLILSKEVISSIEDNKTINLKRLENINNFNIEITKVIYNKDNSNVTIEVKSTFESAEGELKNKKTVSTDYIVTAPDYNSEITSININPVFDGKAITADGNVDVTGGTVIIKGDIWVMGDGVKLDNDPSFTFDKYIGGIKLDNTSFNINGNIYTANTYHLNNNAQSTITGDIFAKNIYVGKSINSDVSKSNNVTFENNVIVNNDLALNATNSSILIKNNFYGINDKTVKKVADFSTADKALNSSSIIVNDITKNDSDKYKIKVIGDSYIMGVAYLNATAEGKKYQTGESVAVKGNYLAYTDVKDILDGKTNVTLKYYSPLQLLESKDEKSNAAMKAEYFTEYYNDSKTEGKYPFNDGGVNLIGNIYSVGASIKDSKVKGSNIEIDKIPTEVKKQQNEFARNVVAMGDATGLGDNLYGEYLYGEKKDNGEPKVQRTVEEQINFKAMDSKKIIRDSDDNIVVLIANKEDKLYIKDDKLYIKDEEITGIEGKISKGLIITNSDITIEGTFDFTGNIITTGNIILKGEGDKIITYDPQVVRNILALNNDILKDVFEKSQASREEIKVTSASELYSVDKFLKKSLWRIVK